MPKYRTDLTAERLKELLSYDPDTGVFRREKTNQKKLVGSVAGCKNGVSGYRVVRVADSLYLEHRLAWLYVWPVDQIDHINGIRDDNRIVNLREASATENMQNYALRRDNSSGHQGVCWNKSAKKWHVQVRSPDGKNHVGYFDSLDAAVEARAKAKAERHAFQPADRGCPDFSQNLVTKINTQQEPTL
jgi:hypothetical protein